MKKKYIPKILVVDDDPVNIDIILESLSGCKCFVAMNGSKALEIVNSELTPDLILLDILMPEMDGYEVIKTLKKNEAAQNIPVIFLTAKSDIESELYGLELGAIDYITKPISPPLLSARVKNHLELKFAREKLERQNEELKEAAHLREDVELMMRHDLKSPLNVITLNAELMLHSESLDQKTVDRVGKIQKAGYRILNMISRSLDLFKMEKGIYEVNFEAVDLVEQLEKIKEESAILCANKNIKILISTEDGVSPQKGVFITCGEKLLFYSVFSNLIKNAIEASPAGRKINCLIFKENSFIIIKFHNEGAVPLEIRNSFFDKYVSSGKRGGTGLGTYSSKLITESMKGKIQMDSSDELGTTITLKFPGNSLNSL